MQFKFFKKNNTSLETLPDKVINICLSLIIFFLPLFFFPLSYDVLELNKIFFFSLLVIVAFLVWLINSVIKKEIVLRQGFLNTLIIVFGIIYLLASLFSINRFVSFLGNSLSYNSLLSIIFFILFYFLIVNTVKGTEGGWKLLRLFLLSGALIVIFNLAQIFGVHILPFGFSDNNAFNLVANSVSAFVIYLVVLFVIGFGYLVKSSKKLDRIFIEILLVMIFALLFFLDKNIGWYLMIFGLFFWLVFLSMQSKKTKAIWVIIPTVLLIACLALLFLSTTSFTLLVPPTDLKLDYQTAFSIARSGLGDSFLFGSGPNGFIYAFNSYRPVSFNDTSLWQLRFNLSHNEIFQLITTAGFFAFTLFIIISLWHSLKIGKDVLIAEFLDDKWFFKTTVFSVFSVIFLSSFFHPFSTVTIFIFWFLLGLGGLILNRDEKKFNLQKSTGINFASSLLFSLLLIGAISFLYFGTRIWLGDYYLAKSQSNFKKTADLAQSREDIIRSIDTNPWYVISNFLLVDNLIKTAAAQVQQNNLAEAQKFLTEAKSETEKALLLDPRNSAIYEKAGQNYQLINSLGGNVPLEEITKTYKKAIELEPNNPALLQAFGNLYLKKAQDIQTALNASEESGDLQKELEENLSKSSEKFEDAIKIKNNYWETEILLSRVLVLQGKYSEAIDRLDTTLTKNPNNLTLLEESGKVLLANKQLELAKKRFQAILALSPNHANAHFWLATIYESQGEKDKAIKELELILKTDPNNALITQKLSQLKGE